MTLMEFEGRTEREAVAKAAAALKSENFDVEVIEKSGKIFGRSRVKIRVRALTTIPDPMGGVSESTPKRAGRKSGNTPRKSAQSTPPPSIREDKGVPSTPIEPPPSNLIQRVCDFITGIIERMGFPGTVAYQRMDGEKVLFEITADDSAVLIGKKGKNIDALQLLANVYMKRSVGSESPWRVVLDAEGYRARREEALMQLANRLADEVVHTQSSRLLEPMNPFERRLIHTAINERDDVVTISEGSGLYKRVRILTRDAKPKSSRIRR